MMNIGPHVGPTEKVGTKMRTEVTTLKIKVAKATTTRSSRNHTAAIETATTTREGLATTLRKKIPTTRSHSNNPRKLSITLTMKKKNSQR